MAFILLYFLLGSLAGTLSGLLGVGGGIIIVPGLVFLFKFQQLPSTYLMHLAIATSLAVIICTALRGLLVHIRQGFHDWVILKRWLPVIAMGTILGAVLSHFLSTRILSICFAIFLLFISIRMFFVYTPKPSRTLPRPLILRIIGFIIGAKSGLLGLGGGSISIPVLVYFNVPMRRAGIISLATSLVIALVGTCSMLLLAWNHGIQLPWTLGYVNGWAWLWTSLGAILFAPLGIKLSQKVSTDWLKRIFGILLFMVAIHLFVNF